MRLHKTTTLAWGLLPAAAFLCHCGPSYSTAPTDAGDAGKDTAEPDTGKPPKDGGHDAPAEAKKDAASTSFSFQPSNVSLTIIEKATAGAMDEDVAGPCVIETDTSGPETDCFNTDGIEQVTQSDGSRANVIVLKSLKIESNGAITVTGTVPLILVSLGDVTISGWIDGSSAGLSTGPGGGAAVGSDAMGLGKGGGLPASDSAAIGGGGASYCGAGGLGGGQTSHANMYGNADLRPLAGGSSGGGGAVGSGAGGGAIQLVAAGTFTMESGSYVAAGGQGGPFGGTTDQNSGGAGSGGAILVEAMSVSMDGTLAANGAGGGGAYSSPSGADATPNATPAPGAAGSTGNGAGGNGSAAGKAAGSDGLSGTGKNGGGGGGGAGWIRISTPTGTATTGGTFSPSLSPATDCASIGKVRTLGSAP